MASPIKLKGKAGVAINTKILVKLHVHGEEVESKKKKGIHVHVRFNNSHNYD